MSIATLDPPTGIGGEIIIGPVDAKGKNKTFVLISKNDTVINSVQTAFEHFSNIDLAVLTDQKQINEYIEGKRGTDGPMGVLIPSESVANSTSVAIYHGGRPLHILDQFKGAFPDTYTFFHDNDDNDNLIIEMQGGGVTQCITCSDEDIGSKLADSIAEILAGNTPLPVVKRFSLNAGLANEQKRGSGGNGPGAGGGGYDSWFNI